MIGGESSSLILENSHPLWLNVLLLSSTLRVLPVIEPGALQRLMGYLIVFAILNCSVATHRNISFTLDAAC